MKILIYGLNYSPELTGIGKYTGETAAWLAARGHDVRVVTAPPYYPAWRISKGYPKVLYKVEPAARDGVPTVYRCPLWVPARPTGITRMVHLLSFTCSSLPVMAIQALWRPDVVFTVEPTLLAAPVALLSATLSGAASWLHIQDMEVDAAFNLGLLPAGGKVQAFAKKLERAFTGRFSRVSSISVKMIDRITAKGSTRNKIVLFPNWGDVDSVRPALPGTENHFRLELKLKEKTVFLYSGNMGAKQGLDTLVSLAESFASDATVHFVFCGDGHFRASLEKMVARLGNVTMLPLQPLNRLNDLLNAADIHLLPQRKDAADLVLPSKLAGMLSSGRPVIAMADEDTQIARVVQGCGLLVPPEEAAPLRAAALRLVKDRGLRASLGSAARDYAVKYLGKEQVLGRFERDILALIHPQERTEDVQLAQSYRG